MYQWQDISKMRVRWRYLINIQVGECPTPNNITGIIILFFSLSVLNSATHYPSLVHQTPSKKSKNIHCTQFIHRCIHRISPIEHSRRWSFCESSITPILYRNQKMVYLALVAANKFFSGGCSSAKKWRQIALNTRKKNIIRTVVVLKINSL